MSVKIFIVTTTDPEPIQIGGKWFAIDDAASDIRGGDFWGDVQEKFPDGVQVKEIRIIPDKPEAC